MIKIPWGWVGAWGAFSLWSVPGFMCGYHASGRLYRAWHGPLFVYLRLQGRLFCVYSVRIHLRSCWLRLPWFSHHLSTLSLSPPVSCFMLSRMLQEEDFQEMVTTAQTLEVQHGHLFEKIIVNDDLSTAFGELRGALKTVETETHWLPVSWTHSWDPHALYKVKREGLWLKNKSFYTCWWGVVVVGLWVWYTGTKQDCCVTIQ